MPSLEFFVVARSLAIDQISNRLSIFHIIDDLLPKSLPAIVPQMSLISTWRLREEDMNSDFQVSVIVKPPGGEKLHPFHSNFTALSSGQRMFQNLGGMALRQPGEYVFEVLLNGNPVANYTIKVHSPRSDAPEDDLLIYPTDIDHLKASTEVPQSTAR